jgi:hypothetical protein
MIPKTVHYCWFGKGKMPEMATRCIASWIKYLPDYELRLWNEDNFDINSVQYVQEAYEARKFAFVTDYVRLYAIYHYGGVYMDTDVEVLKSLDDLLHYPAFSGFESIKDIPTGIMASEQLGTWAKEQLSYYQDRHFLLADGGFDLTTNVQIISQSMAENGFKLNNTLQNYHNKIVIFPKDYFCPKNRDGSLSLTANSYCIHHFEGSWLPIHRKAKKFFFRKIIGSTLTKLLVDFKKIIKKNTT